MMARNEVFIRGTEPVPSGEGEIAVPLDEPISNLPGNHAAELPAGFRILNTGLQPRQDQSAKIQAATTAVTAASRGPVGTLLPGKNIERVPSEGRLHIQTEPTGLEVLIDGQSVGLTPLTVSLPAGKHTYKVIPPPGRAPAERKMQITAAATLTVNIHY
jgi:hypothetical protein